MAGMDAEGMDMSELAKALLTQDLSMLEQMIRARRSAGGVGPHREHAAGGLLQPPHASSR